MQIPNQNEMKTKNPTTKQTITKSKTWSSFCAGQLLLAWSLPWSVVDIPSDGPYWKNVKGVGRIMMERWRGENMVKIHSMQKIF